MADFSITGEVKLNSDPAEQSVNKWTIAAGNLIADFAKKAASSLQSVVKSGITYNAGMESYLTNFKVMLGDEQLAAEKLEEIRKMAASTPFTLSDLTDGTQTLLQFGIAADDTTGVLKRLGDISLGNADKMQTLVRAYGKMSSAQKVTLENVNMMIDAGFNPLNQICDATGETMSELYKRISDGKVGFNELEAAVEAATSEGGQFYNGMLEASQTYEGRLSTLSDNTNALLGKLSDSFYSSLSDLIPMANDAVLELTDAFSEGGASAMLDAAADLLDSFADGVIQKIPDTISSVSDLLEELLNYLAQHQDVFFDSGIELLEQLIIGITDNLPALITAAANLIAQFAAALISHLPDILKCGAALLTTLVDGIIRSIENLGEAALACIAKLTGVWDGSMDEWGRIGENIVQSIINGIANLWGKLTSWFSGLISDLINGTSTTAVTGAVNKISSVTDAERTRRQKLHNERVKQSQDEAKAAANAAQSAEKVITASANKAASSTKKAGSSATKTASEVVKSITKTATEVDGNITRTTETVNETLKNGTTQQKKTVTETSRQMVEGVLSDVKTITTTAADGSQKVTQSIEAVRDAVSTTKDTQTALVDGAKVTVEKTTELLADGSEKVSTVTTRTGKEVIDGVERTVKTVTTKTADGVEATVRTLEDAGVQYASAGELLTTQLQDKLNDGWDAIQEDIQTDALGAIESLATALKNGDLEKLGLWAASYFWHACTDAQKQQINDLALGALNQLSAALNSVGNDLASLAMSLVAKFVPAAASATAGQTALNIAMDANPIGLVISLIGLLVGALINFAGTNESVAAGFKKVWYGVEDVVSFVFESILRVLGLGVQGFVDAVNAVIDTYNWVADKLGLDTISRVSNPLWDAADKIADRRKQRQEERNNSSSSSSDSTGTKKVISSLTDNHKETNPDGSTTTTKTVTEKLQDEAGNITTQVTKTVTEAGKRLVDGVERAYKTVTTFVDGVQTKVETTLDDITDSDSSPSDTPKDPDPAPDNTDAIEDNTAAILAANEKLAEMVRQADGLVLSDNMAVTRTVAASGTAQVAAAANNYHREGDTNITQNIYSKAQTAADLQREARWEADRAKATKR